MLATRGSVADEPDFTLYLSRQENLRRCVFDYGVVPVRSHFFGGGYPTVGDPEDPLLDPFTWLFLPLPSAAALKLRTVAAVLLGVLGVFLLGRRVLRLGLTGASFAALLFGTSRWVMDRIESGNMNEFYHAFAPLWLFLLLTSPRRPIRFPLAVVLIAVTLSDGKHGALLDVLFVGVVCAAWAVFGHVGGQRLQRRRRLVPIGLVACAAAIAAVLAMPRVLPALEVLSHHGGLQGLRLKNHPGHATDAGQYPAAPAIARAVLGLRGMATRNVCFHLGLMPFAGLLAALFTRPRSVAAWLVVALLGVWLALGPHAPLNLLAAFIRLPGCAAMDRPTKYLGPLVTLACILAAAGFVDALAARWPRRWRGVLGAALAVAPSLSAGLGTALTLPRLFPLDPARREPGPAADFYAVRGEAMSRHRLYPMAANAYYNLRMGRGTIDWYTALPLAENAAARFLIDASGAWKANPDYLGEAYFLAGGDHRRVLQLPPVAYRIEPHRISANLEAPEAGRLVINQNFHPGWKLHSPDSGRLADAGGLLAVDVPAGPCTVELRYRSGLFRAGLALSAAGLAALAALTAARMKGWRGLRFLDETEEPAPYVPAVAPPRWMAFAFLALCAIPPLLPQVFTSPDSRILARRASKRLDAGRLPEAVATFEAALTADPQNSGAHVGIALALGRAGQPGRALLHGEAAVRLTPASAFAHALVAAANAELGRIDEAAASFQRAVDLEPRNPEYHTNLARVLADRGDHQAALGHLQAALAANSDHAGAHAWLAIELQRQGRGQDAASHAQEALRLDATAPALSAAVKKRLHSITGELREDAADRPD